VRQRNHKHTRVNFAQRRNAETISAFHPQMHRSKEAARLGFGVLSRVGRVWRDLTEDACSAELPLNLRRVLGELGKFEMRERERPPALTSRPRDDAES
jgi:hypothetical protein